MNEEKYMINIPGNIKLRMELIDGIGLKELGQTIIVGIISAIIGVLINIIFKNYLVAIGFFLGVTAITFVLLIKDSKTNTSTADYILDYIKFFKNQKFFKYIVNSEREENKNV